MRRVSIAMLLTACAGADGQPGADGRDGRDGDAPEITTREASEDDCPAGGTEIEVGDESVVLCNGEDGDDGEPGEPGESGPAGEAGEPGQADESIGRIVVTMFCSGPLADTGSMFATHSIVVFGDGSVWVSASITDGVNQASDSRFFAPEQLGAQTAEVVIAFDTVPPTVGGYWVVNVDHATLASTIEYNDVDWSGTSLWAMGAEDCEVSTY